MVREDVDGRKPLDVDGFIFCQILFPAVLQDTYHKDEWLKALLEDCHRVLRVDVSDFSLRGFH